jgi:PqqA peptide cyclase
MRIFFVAPDFYETRPKKCMNGWGNVFMVVTADGIVLPCHEARMLPGITFPSVRDGGDIQSIWYDSDAFNKYRGDGWMKELCRTCPEKEKDLGGCRCQAFMLTGDATNADPVCDKSPHHNLVLEAVKKAQGPEKKVLAIKPLTYREDKNSRKIAESEGEAAFRN